MFGAVEQPVHWARHMVRTRALQKETGGFTEFVPLPFVHEEAPIALKGLARHGPTFREAVVLHARQICDETLHHRRHSARPRAME